MTQLVPKNVITVLHCEETPTSEQIRYKQPSSLFPAMKQSSFQFCLICLLAPRTEAGPVKFSPRVQRKSFWNKKGRAGELAQ